MKIRIICLPEQSDAAVRLIREKFDVVDQSAPYPCRGDSRQIRIYLAIQT